MTDNIRTTLLQNNIRTMLVENSKDMAKLAHDGGCDTHGFAIELLAEQIKKDGDIIEFLTAEIEWLRETLEYTQPFLEDYLDVALENGHPELIGHATLAVKEVAAALGDTK